MGKIVRIPQEDEIFCGHPAQKLCRLAFVRDRLGGQIVNRQVNLLPHRRIIFDRSANIGQDVGHVVTQTLQLSTLTDPINLDMNPRFGTHPRRSARCPFDHTSVRIALDRKERVQQAMNRQPIAADQHRDGIDEERHVIGDDVDHRMRRMPSVAIEIRGIDRNRGQPWRAHLPQMMVLDRRSVHSFRRAPIDAFGVGIIQIDKTFDLPRHVMAAGHLSQRRPPVFHWPRFGRTRHFIPLHRNDSNWVSSATKDTFAQAPPEVSLPVGRAPIVPRLEPRPQSTHFH